MSDGLRRESRAIENVGDWLQRRRGNLNASQIGAAVRVHPYLSLEGVVGEISGHSVKGETRQMAVGNFMEPAVAEQWVRMHPEYRSQIVKADRYFWLPDLKLGATPDYLVGDDALLECKTVRPEVWDRWHGKPSLAYVLQVLTQLLVTGRSRGVLACMVLADPFPLYEFDVARHPQAEQKIIDIATEFWRAYEAGELPAPQSADEIEAMLDTGEHLDWSNNDEVRQLLEQRRELKATASITAQRLGEVEYKIKNFMGPASTAWLPGYSIQFRRTLRRAYTVDEAFVRTLRIKEIAAE